MESRESLASVKGIGEKTVQLYKKLEIETIEDLSLYFPRTYVQYKEPISINQATVGQRVALKGRVNSRPVIERKGTLHMLSLQLRDETGIVKLVWFNSNYLANVFRVGQVIVVVGTFSYKYHQFMIEHPEYYTPAQYNELKQVYQPVYSLTKGLSNKRIQRDIKAILPYIQGLKEYLPSRIIDETGLMEYAKAVQYIHFPYDGECLKQARERIAFDEFFYFLVMMKHMRLINRNQPNQYKIEEVPQMQEIKNNLGYQLTKAQEKVLKEIFQDLQGEFAMNRLIQGDVGSGKTIVILLALFATVKAGYQGALMAPTEVLATQHYENFKKILEPFGIQIALLIGSTKAKQRKEIYQGISDGSIQIVIGTHALIQEKVEYNQLALVVTDEQHRFGVNQRENLWKKGKQPHVLVVSATPIPRTLGIVIHGDLDISILDELPANRLPIKNCVIGTSARPTAYQFLRKELEQGHQGYVICPMVEDGENSDKENVVGYTQLLREVLPKEYAIEYLHGKMAAKEKQEIMDAFYRREIHLLVSTTVVEVGIDNPNATVIMIENAQQFGLAQLHQLRGRVGRGDAQSYCILVNTSEHENAKERLEVLNHSNDGFHIANEDLRLRGPGEFFGQRQSGEFSFQVADLYGHSHCLLKAREMVNKLDQEGFDFRTITFPQQRAKQQEHVRL